MKVDWRISDDILSGGIIGSNTFVDIEYSMGFYDAILGTQGHVLTDDGVLFMREVLVNKKDPSLIELMNWAEEELKFRESHE